MIWNRKESGIVAKLYIRLMRGLDNEIAGGVCVLQRNAKLYLSECISMDKWCWFKVGEIENVIVRTMFAPIYA